MAEYFVSKHKIRELHQLPFDPGEYSRFKYGSGKVAVQYGQETANAFLEEFVG